MWTLPENIHSLKLRCGSGNEEMELAILQNVEDRAPLNIVEGNLSCTCMQRSPSDDMYHSIPGKGIKGGSENVME